MNEIYLYSINHECDNEIINVPYRDEAVALQNMYQDVLNHIKEAMDNEEKVDFHPGDYCVTVTVDRNVSVYTVERYEVK